jgi:hypothetical protein
MVLTVLRASLRQFFEAEVSGFIAGLRTLPDRLDVLAHVSDTISVPARLGASRQQKSGGTGRETSQQFTTINQGLLWWCNRGLGLSPSVWTRRS